MTLGGGLSRIASIDIMEMTYFACQIFEHKNKIASQVYGPGEYFRKYFKAEAIANEHQSDENNVECDVSTNISNVHQASAISSKP